MLSDALNVNSLDSLQTITDHFDTSKKLIIELQKIDELIHILCGGTENLQNDLNRLHIEDIDHGNVVEYLIQDLSKSKTSTEEQNKLLDEIHTKQQILQQDLGLMKSKLNHLNKDFFDGTFIWKIHNVKENIGKQLRKCHLLFQ